MAAPLPQERFFKQQLALQRLAALRGDSLEIPEQKEVFGEGANSDRFFVRNSEDGFNDSELDPANFAFMQQQARMAEGIGAPEFLSEDLAGLPDPEYSTEDETVTFGESMGVLEQRARNAESLEEAQMAGGEIRNKAKEAIDAGAKELERIMKEKTSRWLVKGAGNGSNALDIVGWDAWIVFAITYVYLMARGVVSILSPESHAPKSFSSAGEGTSYTATKALHVIFPPYRPFQEPGDFLYFLFFFVMSILIVTLIVVLFILFVNIILFPFFMPGGAASAI